MRYASVEYFDASDPHVLLLSCSFHQKDIWEPEAFPLAKKSKPANFTRKVFASEVLWIALQQLKKLEIEVFSVTGDFGPVMLFKNLTTLSKDEVAKLDLIRSD